MTENLIFSAPTSAGKSAVADLLFLSPLIAKKLDYQSRTVEGADLNESEKPVAMFVVPFLSLITEKEAKISSILKELDLSYTTIHSHKRAILPETESPDIVFCTI